MALVLLESLTFGLSNLAKASQEENHKLYLLTSSASRYAYELQQPIQNLEVIEVNTKEVAEVVQAIAQINQTDTVVGLINPTDTFSLIGAQVAEKFQFQTLGYDTLSKIRDKSYLRNKIFAHGLSKSQSYIISSETSSTELEQIKSSIPYPCIIKDNSGTGSGHVHLVNNQQDFAELVATINLQDLLGGSLTIEDYFMGSLYSAEVVSWNGEHKLLAIMGRQLSNEPRFCEEMGMLPIQFSEEQKSKITSLVFSVLDIMGFTQGISHTEFVITKNGIEIIELNPRLAGALTGIILNNILDTNIYEAFVSVALNKRPKLLDFPISYSHGQAMHLIYADKKGIFTNILGLEKLELLPGNPKYYPVLDYDSKIKSIDDQTASVGILLTSGENSEIATINSKSAVNRLQVLVEEQTSE